MACHSNRLIFETEVQCVLREEKKEYILGQLNLKIKTRVTSKFETCILRSVEMCCSVFCHLKLD
jgi:hypothetical protein